MNAIYIPLSRRFVATLVLLASLFLALLPPQVEAQWSSHPDTSRQPAPAVLARVRYIKRGLAVQPPHKPVSKGKVKMPLYSAYLVRTKQRQTASLGFADGTVLHVNQQTDLVLRNSHLTYVKKGEVDEILTPGTNHEVQTATAVAAAIGTEFVVRESVQIREVQKGKGKKRHVQKEKVHKTVFIVVEGALQVTNAKGSILVKTDQKTTVVEGKAPQPPVHTDAMTAITWTKTIPPPTVRRENIGLDANGGTVVAYSSQATGHAVRRQEQGTDPAVGQQEQAATASTWAAGYINDGRLDRGWMSAKGLVTNQWVKLRFNQGNAYMVSGVIIDPSATGGADPSNAMRDFEIRVSTSGLAESDFTTVFTGSTLEQNTLQTFTFASPVSASYIELYAFDNHGGHDGVAVAELEVVGKVQNVAVPTPTPTRVPTPTVKPTVKPTVQPTARPTPTRTATPVPTPTGTPVNTATITPTPTNTPAYITITVAPTNTPTVTPTPTPLPLVLNPPGGTTVYNPPPNGGPTNYSVSSTASGGTPPYCMSVSGSGPNDTISPSASGCGYSSVSISGYFTGYCQRYSFTVTVTDQNKQTASQTYVGTTPSCGYIQTARM